MTGFNVLTETATGPMLVNRHDFYVGRSLLEFGEFSPGEARLFRQILQPGMVALDIGANIGAHTMVMADAVGDTGTVLAFEPQRFVYQALVANIALQSRTNIQPFRQAIGKVSGTLKVPCLDPRVPNNFGGLGLDHFGEGDSVPVTRLNALTLAACHFIKADVEGMEVDVLEGGRVFLAEHQPVLYLEADRPEKQPALLQELDRQGYDAYWHTPPLWEPDMRRPGPNIFTEGEAIIASTNWLCLPRALAIPCNLERVTL